MFPEDFVERHVLTHTDVGDLVFDPFSGRGTTPFQSLLMNRRSAGTDINPVAACISSAKVDSASLLAVLDRIDGLQSGYAERRVDEMGDFFHQCFHANTLPQIIYLRATLAWKHNQVDRFIAAMALGALHGESHRSRLCFSNRMPRTISTKPEYSIRWWKDRGLLPPDRNAFFILKELAKFRLAVEAPQLRGKVVLSDARRASEVHPEIAGQVKLIVTSPPYVDVTDYGEDQWLRLWFLGGPPAPKARSYLDDRHTHLDDYWRFLSEVWSGTRLLLARDAKIVIRIGGKIDLEELTRGLNASLVEGFAGSDVTPYGEVNTSALRKRQTNAFRPGTNTGVEHDFVFNITSAPARKTVTKKQAEPVC